MNKFNFLRIIKNHFCTLCDQSGNYLLGDWIFHLVLPIIISLAICFFDGPMATSIAGVLVNFGAITTALLMSAVLMVYDQKQKVKEKIIKLEQEISTPSNSDGSGNSDVLRDHLSDLEIDRALYGQLCSNISYAILSSAIVVIFSVAISFFTSPVIPFSIKAWVYYGLSALCYFVFISTIITFLMIIKRFSAVLEG